MKTVFQRTEITEPALFNPSDTTKKAAGFPEICVSAFSASVKETGLKFTLKCVAFQLSVAFLGGYIAHLALFWI